MTSNPALSQLHALRPHVHRFDILLPGPALLIVLIGITRFFHCTGVLISP